MGARSQYSFTESFMLQKLVLKLFNYLCNISEEGVSYISFALKLRPKYEMWDIWTYLKEQLSCTVAAPWLHSRHVSISYIL